MDLESDDPSWLQSSVCIRVRSDTGCDNQLHNDNDPYSRTDNNDPVLCMGTLGTVSVSFPSDSSSVLKHILLDMVWAVCQLGKVSVACKGLALLDMVWAVCQLDTVFVRRSTELGRSTEMVLVYK